MSIRKFFIRTSSRNFPTILKGSLFGFTYSARLVSNIHPHVPHPHPPQKGWFILVYLHALQFYISYSNIVQDCFTIFIYSHNITGQPQNYQSQSDRTETALRKAPAFSITLYTTFLRVQHTPRGRQLRQRSAYNRGGHHIALSTGHRTHLLFG